MRHAKSDWNAQGQSDHDRSLNPEGSQGIPSLARWIDEQDLLPDLILASNARRTRQTAELLVQGWRDSPAIALTETLYLASPESIVQVINQDGCDYSNLMILGHNPGLSYLASTLSGELVQLPPAGIISFEVQIEQWSDFRSSSKVALAALLKPKSV